MARDDLAVAAELGRASDAQLLELVADPAIASMGRGRVELGGRSVFAKLVPITELELRPENRESTANLFGLPPHYHYRIGSRGFGAWRELAMHRLANRWLDSDACAGLVRLYHARVMPVVAPTERDDGARKRWGNDPAIDARLDAVESATSSLVLFLEDVPMTLLDWLSRELPRSSDAGAIVTRVDRAVRDILAFVNAQGVRHMDAHFENILTDGDRFVLADFGLALSRSFDLGSDEERFADDHAAFDQRTATTSLVHAVISTYEPSDDWRQPLREPERWRPSMPPSIREFLHENAPTALATGEFYRRLMEDLAAPPPPGGHSAH